MHQLNQKLEDYKALILDLDGTLYEQKPLQRVMFFQMMGYYIFHIKEVKDLYLLYCYRRLRERWKHQDVCGNLEAIQYEILAKERNTKKERVHRVVTKWMHKRPLEILFRYRDEELIAIVEGFQKNHKTIIIYSDYPVKDKLNALGVTADAMFCSADREISCMKPERKGIEQILRKTGLDPKEVLFIGDRYEKDGLSAKSVGMDFLIVPSALKKRKIIYEQLKNH